jgi:hypothetical protein
MNCKDEEKTLARKLVELFYEVNPENVIQSIKEAQKFIDKEKLLRGGLYRNLFDYQVYLLEKFLIDQDFEIDNIDSLIACIRRQKNNVVEKAVDMYIPENHIPFLIVLDFSKIIPIEKISLILDKDVKIALSLDGISHKKGCKGFHIVYDIDNGKETVGKSSCCVNEIFKSSERFALTFDESLMLCFWDGTLMNHSVVCAGSFYQEKDKILGVPKILKGNDSSVSIGFVSCNKPDELSGIPSCRCYDFFC